MYNFDHIELLRRKSPKKDFASDMFSVDTENVPVTNYLSSPSIKARQFPRDCKYYNSFLGTQNDAEDYGL